MKAPTLQTGMRPSSEFRHRASSSSSSSTHFRFQHGTFGELSEAEDNTVTMATMIGQHKKWMMEESTPLQFQHNNLGSKKEEHVIIQGKKEEEYLAIQEEDTPLQFQHNNLGSKKEEHVTIQGRKEEEYVTVQVEPDAPQMQGVAAQSSFNHSEPMADSESGIMSYAVLVEPDAPQMQGVATQSSFNHSGPMADSGSGIMSYAVLIILGVAGVIIGLDLYFRA